MPIERRFLGWDRPALHSASQWLIASNKRDGIVDLADVVVGLSGRRAGRHLLERLVADCEELKLKLKPPRVVTAEPLANLLLGESDPIVPQPLRQMAWLEALAAESDLSDLVPQPPAATDLRAWSGIGQAIERVHVELASAGMQCSDVISAGEHIEAFGEEARWGAIGRVVDRYLTILKRERVADPQQARVDALRVGDISFEKTLVLVGLSDMNPILKQLVDHVSDHCVALVFGPESYADRFDAWGCIVPEAWAGRLPLSSDQIIVTDRPQDQVLEALDRLAEASTDQTACLAVVDDGLVPVVRGEMRLVNIPVHIDDFRLEQSRPYQLLESVAGYLSGHSAAGFAGLIRQCDFEYRVLSKLDVQWPEWIGDLDQAISDHLPKKMTTETLEAWAAPPNLAEVVGCTQGMLQGLWDGRKTVRAWAMPIVECLNEIYGSVQVDPAAEDGARLLGAIDRIMDGLRQVHLGSIDGPRVCSAEAIRWYLSILADEPVPTESQMNAVEGLGWLDLLMDEAVVPILIGCNEHALASASGPDAFLPETLRTATGLIDRDRRYARDAYALEALVASRPQTILIAGRRTSEGEPLMLSRLLLSDEPPVVAERVLRFVAEPESPSPRSGFEPAVDELFGDPNRWPPRADPLPLESLGVTAFADYLACPYRFYLRHVLKLRGLDDSAVEMDGGVFGNVIHDVLNAFARSDVDRCKDDQKILAFLIDQMKSQLKERYGSDLPPAIGVQREQLQHRLIHFAQWQAQWCSAGWNIMASEKDLRAPLPVDGQAFAVTGRIDRIDQNRQTGDLMVFDYKTGSIALDPEKSHRNKGRWIGLQLPLYHHLATSAGYEPIVGLGYIAVPADVDQFDAFKVSWSDQELDEAIETARGVVSDILAGRFELDTSSAPRYEPFAAICGIEQFRHLGVGSGGGQ